jgi:hypothetical protein
MATYFYYVNMQEQEMRGDWLLLRKQVVYRIYNSPSTQGFVVLEPRVRTGESRESTGQYMFINLLFP